MGLTAWGSDKGLYPLRKCDKLIRELKNLDAAGAVREQHKFAVIYIAPGQDTKVPILANMRGSLLYDDFVRGLGWRVCVDEHIGYSGKVKKGQFPNSWLPYYATPALELFFHVATMMFPSGVDSKQGECVRVCESV